LLLVAYFVDVGEAVSLVAQADWYWLVPAVVIVQIQILLSALRWKITANRLGLPLTTRRAISEYYLATFANLTLPGGITGDAARVYRNRQPKAVSMSVHSVLIERLAGQLALLIVIMVGWMMWPLLMQGSMPEFGRRVIGSTLMVSAALALIVFLVVRFAPEWITRKVVNFGPAIHTVLWADRQWIVQSVLSLSIVLTYMLVFLCCSYAVQAPLSLAAMITMVPP